MSNPKPMREVSKRTPKAGSKGPPSSHKSDIKEGKGHKQTGGAKKSAEGDMQEQRQNNKQLTNADPFRELMAMASRNARFSVPANYQGVADPGDPANVSPDEIENMPRRKRMS